VRFCCARFRAPQGCRRTATRRANDGDRHKTRRLCPPRSGLADKGQLWPINAGSEGKHRRKSVKDALFCGGRGAGVDSDFAAFVNVQPFSMP
jgi:hypothetical protein